MKATTIAATAGIILSLVSAAEAQNMWNEIKASGKIIVANEPNYPPMEYKDPATNTLMGVDIDLGTALAKELGLKIEWTEIGFAQMISSLNTGRVNMIHSGMSDLPSRRETLDFVDYMKSGAQFYTSFDRRNEYKQQTDFCGKKIGMSKRTSFPDETNKWSKENCEAKGKPAIIVVGTEGSADARVQLKQGRVDGAVQGSETLPYLLQGEKDAYVIVGDPFTAVFQGIGFKKEEQALRDAYAGALQKLMTSGEYKKIFDKWGLGITMLDKVQINGEPVK